MAPPPPQVRDRALGTVDPDATVETPSPPPDTVDVACWTPVGDDRNGSVTADGLRTTLLADSSLPDDAAGPVAHTLVLEVDVPTRSVTVDYRSLDAAVVSDHGVNVRTDDDESVAVGEARVAEDGTFSVTFAEPQVNGALFIEYAATRNPPGGKHAVGVVVDGVRETEARLVVVG